MVIVETFLLTNGNIAACKKESVRVLVVCLNSVLSWFILTSNIWLQCGEKKYFTSPSEKSETNIFKVGNILTGRLLRMTVQSWARPPVFFTVAKATRTLEYKAEKLTSTSTPHKNIRSLLCGSSEKQYNE